MSSDIKSFPDWRELIEKMLVHRHTALGTYYLFQAALLRFDHNSATDIKERIVRYEQDVELLTAHLEILDGGNMTEINTHARVLAEHFWSADRPPKN